MKLQKHWAPKERGTVSSSDPIRAPRGTDDGHTFELINEIADRGDGENGPG